MYINIVFLLEVILKEIRASVADTVKHEKPNPYDEQLLGNNMLRQ